MKRIFILTLIFMKAGFSFAQEVKSLNQECNPTFKEIFNFQVGDYFNYEINEWQESWAVQWMKMILHHYEKRGTW